MTTRAKLVLKPSAPEPPAADPVAPVALPAEQAKTPKAVRADRQAKRIIAGHFPKATWMQLRMLCTKRDTTSQALLEEALTDLFAKYRV